MHSKLIFALTLSATLVAAMAVDSNALAQSHAPDFGTAIMSANVGEDGSLQGGAGAVGVTRRANGLYFVAFNRSVQGCAYAGGVSGPLATTDPGFVFTEGRSDTFNGAAYYGVSVTTSNPDGLADGHPFHVIVFCSN